MAGNYHDTAAAAVFSDEKMAKQNLYESPRMFCDVYGLLPGQGQKPHVHAENDKVYSVLSGRVRVDVGDERRSLGPGEVAVAPAGAEHGLLNESDAPATLLVVMAPHPRPQG